ncbi:MAG: transporter, family, inner rane transport protein [Alphaproteobacteria bacterium]|nr:transporter, family, inner rane transport protein [Alphaproteobacteria bacterium]
MKIVYLVVFASTLFTRAVDPVIPQIAADLLVDVNTAALLSTAYTLPYALVQPILGTMADFFGKTRLMNISLFVVGFTALICAVATSFSLLVGMRIAAGLVAGGVFPVAMALIGDLVPVNQRQVAIGRMLAIGLTGNLLGASISGVIADAVGWRGVFVVLGVFGLIMASAAFLAFRHVTIAKPTAAFNRAAVIAGFRGIFADPRAKVCFTSVFFEAVFIHGVFPYVAILLLAAGETRASIAGVVIAAFGVGGVIYSLSVPVLVANIAERRLMIAGGTLAAIGLVLTALHFPWYVQFGVFSVLGFGFYLLHGCIQVHVTELSSTARGAAASLHSCFFYLGQAVGPVVYAFGFAYGGPEPSLLTGAVVVMLVGLVCSQLLRHRAASH